MMITREICPETLSMLQCIYRHSRHHQVRQRAHCLILKHQGLKMNQLEAAFQVERKTLYNWFNAWNDRGLAGLYNRPGRGRKPTFNQAQKEQIRRWAAEHPKQLKKILRKVQETWDITVSDQTIKRVLKSVRMSWHRFRRGVAKPADPKEYALKRLQLDVLKRLEAAGKIRLGYLDEVGFCLVPCIPYGWQPIGVTLEIPSQPSRRLNVLGLMSRDLHLESYVSEQSITSDVVIACIDAFLPTVDKPTVIVMDQASIHTSGAIQDKREEWEARDILLFELPRSAPELNLIEIAWRFMKYEWIELSAYQSWQSLIDYVEKVLRGFGKEYVINFA